MKNQNVYRARQNRKKWARNASKVRAGYVARKTQLQILLETGMPTFKTSDGRAYKGHNDSFHPSTIVRLN